MQTYPANQWLNEWLMEGFELAAEEETKRRQAINAELMRGLKLSTRVDAVMRDIQRAWLVGMLPAGRA